MKGNDVGKSAIQLANSGRIEGIAAARKRPGAVMAGQIAYSASLLAACAVLLPLGCPGWLMALVAIFIAPVCTVVAVYVALARGGKG